MVGCELSAGGAVIQHLFVEDKSSQRDGPPSESVVAALIAALDQHVADGVNAGKLKDVEIAPQLPADPDLRVEVRGAYLVIRKFELFQDPSSPFGGVHRLRVDRWVETVGDL